MRKNIAIVIIVIIGTIISLTALFMIKNYTARRKVVAAKAIIEKHADMTFSDKVHRLKGAGVLLKQIASSKIDFCYIEPAATMMISYWYQNCHLQYIDGYEAKLGREETIQRLSEQNSGNLFGERQRIDSPDGRTHSCLFFLESGQTVMPVGMGSKGSSILYLPAGGVPRRNVGWSTCRVPTPQSSYTRNRGESIKVKADRTFNVKEIDNRTNQIWITEDYFYYHEKLGCSWGGLLCDSPKSEPVME